METCRLALDSAEHPCDPPVAWHNDLADDAPALVVVRPRPVTAQGLMVALAVAVTAATVLAAVALLVQGVSELQSDFSLQKKRKKERRVVRSVE